MKYKLNVTVASFDNKSTWTENWDYETDVPASLEELKNYAKNVIFNWNSSSSRGNERKLIGIDSIGLYPGTILDTGGEFPALGGLDVPRAVEVQQDIMDISALREFLAEEDTEESCIANSVIDWLINPDSELDLPELKSIIRYGV